MNISLAQTSGGGRGSAIACFPLQMLPKGRILVVDDDHAIRALVAKIVERAGFPVDVAVDGREAIAKIGVTTYAVCVIDLMMPNINGYDIVNFIRDHAVEPRPAVIVITAVGDSSAILPLDGRIVHSIVRKPFDIAVLGELITATATAMTAQQSAESEDDGRVLPFPRSNES